MVEALQRMWSLAVLKASLLSDQEIPQAELRFVVNEGGASYPEDSAFTFPVSELGDLDALAQGKEIDATLSLPATAAEWIDRGVERLRIANLGEVPVLWLHLKKPYGFLGAVRWEEQLAKRLAMPVLRLPDVLPRPVESLNSLNVVLCASNGVPGAEGAVGRALITVAQAIERADLDRVVTLHIFTDLGLAEYAEQVEAQARHVKVRVHEPVDPNPDIVEPWFDWIQDAAGNRSIGAIHLISHGTMVLGSGRLVFTESPNMSADGVRNITPEPTDVSSFASRLGAWTLGFTSPVGNVSEIGLRLLADRCGATRSGSVIYQSLTDESLGDDDIDNLARVYRFLYATESPEPPPAAGVMLYAQPERLAFSLETPSRGDRDAIESSPQVWPEATQAYSEERGASDEIRQVIEQSEDVPAWINVAQRYIDGAERHLLGYEDQKRNSGLTEIQQAQYEGLQTGMNQARSILEKHAFQESERWEQS